MNPEISEWGEGRVIFFDTVLFEDLGEKKRAILEHTGVIGLCLDEGVYEAADGEKEAHGNDREADKQAHRMWL